MTHSIVRAWASLTLAKSPVNVGRTLRTGGQLPPTGDRAWHEVSAMPARQPGPRQVLPRLRGPPDPALHLLWHGATRECPLLPAVWPSGLGGRAYGRKDLRPHERARGRAQADHGALRRPQGLDGAARRSRPRGGAQDSRSDPRADDGSRPSLPGDRQPGHGRRRHGALRRTARARGPCRPGVLRRAGHAGSHPPLRRAGPSCPRPPDRDPGRAELG